MTEDEIERRSQATIQARQKDATDGGLYFQVWRHLCQKGLIGKPGDRQALAEEVRQIQRQLSGMGSTRATRAT